MAFRLCWWQILYACGGSVTRKVSSCPHRNGITFQRTKTWRESTDPDRDAELSRIEYVSSNMPQRVFAFDEFGPLAIRPSRSGVGCRRTPARLPPRRPHRQQDGIYGEVGDQTPSNRRPRPAYGLRTVPQPFPAPQEVVAYQTGVGVSRSQNADVVGEQCP